MAQPSYVNNLNNNWVNNRPPTASEPLDSGIISLFDSWWDNSTTPWSYYICMDPTADALTWQRLTFFQPDWNQATSSAIDYIKNKPSTTASYSSPAFSSITTATRLSTTRDAYVNYVFPTSMTSLLTSQSLTATLQYADDSGMSTNLITANVDVNGCSGILSLTLAGRLQVSGRIPPNKYRRVVLAQTGGATVPTTISSSQEVLI